MNVREAILKASEQIESDPWSFDFDEISKPNRCGTPGCALGWIGFFCGISQVWWKSPEFYAALGLPTGNLGSAGDDEFYVRMGGLVGDGSWRYDAVKCAGGLRLYADKYHPAETPKHTDIPASVRAIFETEQSALV